MQRSAGRCLHTLLSNRTPLLGALLVGAALLVACGGGGGTPPPEPNLFLLMADTPAGRIEVMTAVDDPAGLARNTGAAFSVPAPARVHTPVFGPDGRIYLADAAGAQIFVYDAVQALEQAAPAAVATLSSAALMQPVALAFSPQGELWVADRRDSQAAAPVANRLIRFGDVSGLTGAQVLVPEASVELALEGGASTANTQISSILLDTVGGLWFTDLTDWSVGRLEDVSLLTGTVTGHVPALKFASIDFATPEASSIRNPTSLAFDFSGRLYVGGVGQSVVARYDVPSALVDGDRQTEPSAVIRVEGAPLANSAAIGFDQDGALWVASSSAVEGTKSELLRLGIPGTATGEVALTPSARFEWSAGGRSSGGTLLFHPPGTPR